MRRAIRFEDRNKKRKDKVILLERLNEIDTKEKRGNPKINEIIVGKQNIRATKRTTTI